jgi:DNA repair protein RadC
VALHNPLPSFHPRDREPYADLIKRVCNCASSTAERIAVAYPDGLGIENANKAELRHLGATDRQADRLVAAFELSREAAKHRKAWRPQIKAPNDVVTYLNTHLPQKEQESFVVLLLDSRQRVIDARTVSIGSLAQVDVHPRELFRDAIRIRAHSVILAHNHPSGDPEPSEADVNLTNRMAEAGRLVGIPVLDHIVVGGDDSTSLASLGLMPTLTSG